MEKWVMAMGIWVRVVRMGKEEWAVVMEVRLKVV